MDKAYTFSDVLIVPKYSEVMSRSQVNLSSDLGFKTLDLPVISSNMKDITGWKMARAMARSGGYGILHRFCSIDDAAKEFILIKNDYGHDNPAAVSVGVKDDARIRVRKLHSVGVNTICVDVAHGHHALVKKTIKFIKEFDDNIYVIAGNVATAKGALDLCEWGADAVKVGIGPGHGCHTRLNTGIGVPQLYALKQVSDALDCENFPNKKIIADGGMSNVSDMAKALIYADAIMLGYYLAACSETPGKAFERGDGQYYKMYGGSTSGEHKDNQGQKIRFVEGAMREVPFRGKVDYRLRKIKEGLQSALSYVGASNLKEFRTNVELIEISSGSKIESKF